MRPATTSRTSRQAPTVAASTSQRTDVVPAASSDTRVPRGNRPHSASPMATSPAAANTIVRRSKCPSSTSPVASVPSALPNAPAADTAPSARPGCVPVASAARASAGPTRPSAKAPGPKSRRTTRTVRTPCGTSSRTPCPTHAERGTTSSTPTSAAAKIATTARGRPRSARTPPRALPSARAPRKTANTALQVRCVEPSAGATMRGATSSTCMTAKPVTKLSRSTTAMGRNRLLRHGHRTALSRNPMGPIPARIMRSRWGCADVGAENTPLEPDPVDTGVGKRDARNNTRPVLGSRVASSRADPTTSQIDHT